MQIFGKGQKPAADSTSPAVAVKKNGNRFSNNKRSIIAVALVVLAALCLRMIFSVGISAGSDFALSGGVTATQHLSNIVEIMKGNLAGLAGTLAYPDGSVNVIPILMDLVLAGFALIIQGITGMDPTQSASLALGASAPIMGALACIPMYFLGKEIFGGKKRAGFLAALFLAFCPVAVTNTVFSNGTEIAFVLFFFICALFFAVKGIKCLDCDRSAKDGFGQMISQNKSAIKYAVVAGVFLTLIAYTWNGFRSTIVLFLVAMGVMVIYNRLRNSDPRPVAVFFSVIAALPIILAAPYYIGMGLWDLVFSGIAIGTALAVVCCVSFALLRDKPWTTTIPVYAVVLIALFVALFFLAPSLYSDIVNGNSVYSSELAGIVGSGNITFSEFVTFYGFMTVWCAPIVAIYMISKFKGNVGNVAFLALFVGLVLGIILSVSSTMAAVAFSPIYALGFAGVITWVFDKISYSDYFKSFRGCDFKTLMKRIFSPKPFISIVCVVLLVGAPNAIGAMDASISYNEKTEWNDTSGFDLLGALGYTVYTKDDYRIKETLKAYADENRGEENVVVTWMDYSTDVSLYGNFKSMTDNLGNNTVPMANIFLADETRGEATAAMIVYVMKNYGTAESIKVIDDLATGGQITIVDKELVLNQIKKALDDPHSLRNIVLGNPDFYGDLSTSVSDENITYIYLKKFLTQGVRIDEDHDPFEGFTIVELSTISKRIMEVSKIRITHVLGTLSMIPVQYGDGSVFSTMAAINGYNLDPQYGYVPEFYSFYSGSYYANTTMKNTLLYKLVMGKTSEEATDSGDSSRFESVYQFCNFEADYDHFFVRYNAKDDAAATDDGWQDLLYQEAYKLKGENGKGTINPYAFPILAKYVPAFEAKKISGNVERQIGGNADTEPVKNARVEFWTNDGLKYAMAYTDENGYFELPITTSSEESIVGPNAVFKVYAGSAKDATTGGSLIYSENITSVESQTGKTITIGLTSINGEIDFTDEDDPTRILDITDIDGAKVTMTAKNHDDVEYEFMCGEYNSTNHSLPFESDPEVSLVIDTYDVKVTSANGTSLGSATYDVKPGQNNAYIFVGTVAELKLTVTDQNGEKLEGIEISLSGDGVFNTGGVDARTDIKGEVTIYVSPGKYNVAVKDTHASPKRYVIVSGGEFTVSGSSSSQTVKLMEAEKVTITSSSCPLDTLVVTNGTSNFVATKDGTDYVVDLPLPDINESTHYQAYGYDSGHNLYYVSFSVNKNGVDGPITLPAAVQTTKVSGLMTNKDGDPVGGKIMFFTDDGIEPKNETGYIITAQAIKLGDKDEYRYTAYLPEGSYYEYASDSSSQAILTNEDADRLVVSSDDVERNIKLEEGYKLSVTLRWGSSNAFKYTGITATVYKKDSTNPDDDQYVFNLATDSSGKASLIMPKNRSGQVVANVDDRDNTASDEPLGTYVFSWEKDDQDKPTIPVYHKEYDFTSDKHSSYMTANVCDKDIPITPGNEDEEETYKYSVLNETNWDLKIGDETIAPNGTYYSKNSLKNPYITIKMEYQFIVKDSKGYYYSLSLDIPIDYRNDGPNFSTGQLELEKVATKYVKVAVAYIGDKPTVSLKNIRTDDVVDKDKPFKDLVVEDEGTVTLKENVDPLYNDGYRKAIIKYISFNETTATTDDNEYGLTNPYLLKVSYTKSNDKWVYYQTLKGDEYPLPDPPVPHSPINADQPLGSIVVTFHRDGEGGEGMEPGDVEKASYFTGVTGYSADGTLVVTQKDSDGVISKFTEEIDNGAYEVLLPYVYGENLTEYSYTLQAYQEKEINDLEKVKYESELIEIHFDQIDDSYIVNLPVTSVDGDGNDDPVPPSVELNIAVGDMTGPTDGVYKIKFNANLKNFDKGTYLLEAGSAWMHLTFFSDIDCKIAIESVVIGATNENVTVYAIGYAKMGTKDSTAACDSRDLSVIVKALNGDEKARGIFGDRPSNWASTTGIPIELDFGTYRFGSGERSFSIKLTNMNNYPVNVTLELENLFGMSWYYSYNDSIVAYDPPVSNGEGEPVAIAGASSLELNITVMSKNGMIPESYENTVGVTLKTTGETFVISKDCKTTDDNNITLSEADKTAEINMKVTPGSANIESSGTEGGGVFDDLGSAPRILSFLAAFIIIELIVFFWIGIKKGVFGRRK